MTKRKSEIFMVVESVTNWFEASEYIVTEIEEAGGVDNCSGSGSSVASQASVDVESANWSDNGIGEEARSDVATRRPNEGTAGTGSFPRLTAVVRPSAG